MFKSLKHRAQKAKYRDEDSRNLRFSSEGREKRGKKRREHNRRERNKVRREKAGEDYKF